MSRFSTRRSTTSDASTNSSFQVGGAQSSTPNTRGRSRATSPPVPLRVPVRSQATPGTSAKSEVPFKLEKMVHVDQEKWSLAQQRRPRLDQLQGAAGALVRCCYTAFVDNIAHSTNLANGLCLISCLLSFISCVICELIAFCHISQKEFENEMWWPHHWGFLRAPFLLLLLFLSKYFGLELSSAWSISRDLHLYHLLGWLVVAEFLGHFRLFGFLWNGLLNLLWNDVPVDHLYYLAYSLMSPLLFCLHRELFVIVREDGADDAVVPPSQWFGFRTMFENWR